MSKIDSTTYIEAYAGYRLNLRIAVKLVIYSEPKSRGITV